MRLQHGLRFYIPLESLAFYSSLPTTMSSVAANHAMNLFYLMKENFKNLLFDSLITRRSFKNLSYLFISCSLSQRWIFQTIRSNVLRGINQSLNTQTYRGLSLNIFYILVTH